MDETAMARRVFYSFHYKPDNWRAGQVRKIGAIEGNEPAKDNDWEAVKRGGCPAIKRWIAGQMKGRTCTVVLVGTNTANRKWINYEIKKSWRDGKGLVGIRIHGLENSDGDTSSKGTNPFARFSYEDKKLSSIVKCYDPVGQNSKERYRWIAKHLAKIVEEAIHIRNAHRRSDR